MALVGANFPDMKAPGEAGEITNTPVKDFLEQFKVDEESGPKDGLSEKGSANSKCLTSIQKDVSIFWVKLHYKHKVSIIFQCCFVTIVCTYIYFYSFIKEMNRML